MADLANMAWKGISYPITKPMKIAGHFTMTTPVVDTFSRWAVTWNSIIQHSPYIYKTLTSAENYYKHYLAPAKTVTDTIQLGSAVGIMHALDFDGEMTNLLKQDSEDHLKNKKKIATPSQHEIDSDFQKHVVDATFRSSKDPQAGRAIRAIKIQLHNIVSDDPDSKFNQFEETMKNQAAQIDGLSEQLSELDPYEALVEEAKEQLTVLSNNFTNPNNSANAIEEAAATMQAILSEAIEEELMDETETKVLKSKIENAKEKALDQLAELDDKSNNIRTRRSINKIPKNFGRFLANDLTTQIDTKFVQIKKTRIKTDINSLESNIEKTFGSMENDLNSLKSGIEETNNATTLLRLEIKHAREKNREYGTKAADTVEPIVATISSLSESLESASSQTITKLQEQLEDVKARFAETKDGYEKNETQAAIAYFEQLKHELLSTSRQIEELKVSLSGYDTQVESLLNQMKAASEAGHETYRVTREMGTVRSQENPDEAHVHFRKELPSGLVEKGFQAEVEVDPDQARGTKGRPDPFPSDMRDIVIAHSKAENLDGSVEQMKFVRELLSENAIKIIREGRFNDVIVALEHLAYSIKDPVSDGISYPDFSEEEKGKSTDWIKGVPNQMKETYLPKLKALKESGELDNVDPETMLLLERMPEVFKTYQEYGAFKMPQMTRQVASFYHHKVVEPVLLTGDNRSDIDAGKTAADKGVQLRTELKKDNNRIPYVIPFRFINEELYKKPVRKLKEHYNSRVDSNWMKGTFPLLAAGGSWALLAGSAYLLNDTMASNPEMLNGWTQWGVAKISSVAEELGLTGTASYMQNNPLFAYGAAAATAIAGHSIWKDGGIFKPFTKTPFLTLTAPIFGLAAGVYTVAANLRVKPSAAPMRTLMTAALAAGIAYSSYQGYHAWNAPEPPPIQNPIIADHQDEVISKIDDLLQNGFITDQSDFDRFYRGLGIDHPEQKAAIDAARLERDNGSGDFEKSKLTEKLEDLKTRLNIAYNADGEFSPVQMAFLGEKGQDVNWYASTEIDKAIQEINRDSDYTSEPT